MTTKCILELTCDACGKKSDDAYSWARIDISGSSANMGFGPDRRWDACPECWKEMRKVIYPQRVKEGESS